MAENWLFWLDELRQDQHALVGRKCANLGEMTRIGLHVPEGFALSVDAYLKFMNATGAAKEIREQIESSSTSGSAQLFELSVRLRQTVESKPMPTEMEETISEFYNRLCRRCGVKNVAVSTRSAGPLSHPGQYETYLNVAGKSEVVENIKRVWASTFNPRSLAFRRQKGLPLDSDPIGVAVLRMVKARTAGVAFTADPNTGDSSRIIIEANWGLGESVVNGESTPDIYIVDKDTLEIQEKKLGPKYRCIVADKIGVIEIETPPEKISLLCLNDEEIKTIAKLGKKLEEHFSSPQDLEWAVDQDAIPPQNIILLQTRPEIISQQKTSIDQIADLMLDHFSGGAIPGGGGI
jgi:pyruvate,water dikinase